MVSRSLYPEEERVLEDLIELLILAGVDFKVDGRKILCANGKLAMLNEYALGSICPLFNINGNPDKHFPPDELLELVAELKREDEKRKDC